MVKVLLNHGMDINALDHMHCTPLHYAVSKKHPRSESLKITELLIRSGANVNARDCNGQTSLHYLVTSKESSLYPFCIELASKLLDAGADINAVDVFGNAPLHYAAERVRRKMDQLQGQSDNANNNNNADMMGSYDGALQLNREFILYLIIRGADVNIANRAGAKALDKIHKWDKVLKKHVRNILKADYRDTSGGHLTIKRQRDKIVQLFNKRKVEDDEEEEEKEK